jgi:hypothetical protein
MAHRNYLIHYPNGFKRHVSSVELATHSGLEQIGPKEYRASSLQTSIEQTNGPSYLAGQFIIQRGTQREYERLQTPKGQIEQLERMGWKAQIMA